ncbi:hypothetical protein [Streptomyces sp. V4I23]|uniref:hypothetical protein n=1 Tax=Streptomyces sp. V4I23 TaxID=3042282 RepID=UPI0027D819D3|nr:hypothetical protein [Streptomyces sp. V4I23]
MDLNDVGHATGMYVHPQGAELAIKPSDHAVMALRLAEAHVPHLYLPIGHWASQTLVRLVELSDDGEPAAGDDETPRDAKA